MTNDAKPNTAMREGFEQQRKAGMNVDWFTWQIAWHDALFTQRDIAGDSTPSATAVDAGAQIGSWRDAIVQATHAPSYGDIAAQLQKIVDEMRAALSARASEAAAGELELTRCYGPFGHSYVPEVVTVEGATPCDTTEVAAPEPETRKGLREIHKAWEESGDGLSALIRDIYEQGFLDGRIPEKETSGVWPVPLTLDHSHVLAHCIELQFEDEEDADQFFSMYSAAMGNAAVTGEPVTLTHEELRFVELVRDYPGRKLNGGEAFGESGDALWTRLESLGLIECVGSYKWRLRIFTPPAASGQKLTDEPTAFGLLCAALTGLSNHIKACPEYEKLRGDMEFVDQAIAELSTEAKLRRMADDAGRSRWLRDSADGGEGAPFIATLNLDGYTGQLDGEAADDAIDRASDRATASDKEGQS